MRRPVRAVIYGVGAMGCVATRMMLEKGVDIVGAIARSDAKVGKDLGEVANLGFSTRLMVERDAAQVLGERAADIAIVPIASYMDDMLEHLKLCAGSRSARRGRCRGAWPAPRFFSRAQAWIDGSLLG